MRTKCGGKEGFGSEGSRGNKVDKGCEKASSESIERDRTRTGEGVENEQDEWR